MRTDSWASLYESISRRLEAQGLEAPSLMLCAALRNPVRDRGSSGTSSALGTGASSQLWHRALVLDHGHCKYTTYFRLFAAPADSSNLVIEEESEHLQASDDRTSAVC